MSKSINGANGFSVHSPRFTFKKEEKMWVEIEDIEDRWISSDRLPEDRKLQTIIDDFEVQVLRRFPDINSRITGETLDETFVIGTISNWVIEYVITGLSAGKTQESQAYTGFNSRSVSYDTRNRRDTRLSESDLSVFEPVRKASFAMLSMVNHRPKNSGVNCRPEFAYFDISGWDC